jgi:uncharacterized protein involved in response to NO
VPRQITKRAFLRDVWINLLANLIAAAIIYVLGVLVGVFPNDPKVFASAVSVLLFTAATPTILAGSVMRGRGKQIFGAGGSLLIGLGLIAAGIGGKNLDGQTATSNWDRGISFFIGAIFIIISVLLAFQFSPSPRDGTELVKKTRPRLREPRTLPIRRRHK